MSQEEQRDCTNCHYGVQWGYFGGRSDSPIMPNDHISGRCRWKETRTDIKFPRFFSEGVLFSLEHGSPIKDCNAWEMEAMPGAAPKWGELRIDWMARINNMVDECLREIDRKYPRQK